MQSKSKSHIIDTKMLSIRYPTEVNLVGDSAAMWRALIPLLTRKDDRSWQKKIEKGNQRMV